MTFARTGWRSVTATAPAPGPSSTERAARLAGHLAAQGVGAESRVAVALYNGIEYLESVFAILKLRAVPVNVNYRYRRDEIVQLLDGRGRRGRRLRRRPGRTVR